MKQKKRKKTIAVFSETPLFDIPIFLLEAVEKVCKKHNANMMYITSKAIRSPIKHHIQSNILFDLHDSSRIDGIIVASNLISTYVDNNEFFEFCALLKSKPVISLAKQVPGIPSIIIDNEKGVYDLTRHMIDSHKLTKLGFITGPVDNEESNARLAGFKRAMKEAGLEIDADLIVNGNFQIESGKSAIQELLKNRKKIPGKDIQGVFTANDYMALGALQALAEADISVPEQITVCGFDDVSLAKHFEPPLTTIVQPFAKMAAKAADLLFEHFEGKTLKETYKISCDSIYRVSCGCPFKEEIDSDITVEIPKAAQIDNDYAKEKLLPVLNRLIFETNATRNVLFVWSHALSLLNKAEQWPIKTFIDNNEDIALRDKTWPVIYSTAKRAIHIMNYQQLFSGMKTELMSTHDTNEIMDLLYKYLPRIGIKQCYISMYTHPVPFIYPQELPEECRLILAFDETSRLSLPDNGLLYSTREILPDSIIKTESAKVLIIEDLYFQGEQIGMYCMDTGLVNKTLYTELNIQISNALFGSLLIQREKEKTEALSIANKQIKELNESLKDENIQIRAEMNIARRIQTNLLPKDIYDIHPDFNISAKMVTAEEVGGDYYDIMKDKNGKLWCAIGDVSGHGVTAGLVMMMAQTVHATITTQYNASPKDIVSITNRIIFRNMQRKTEMGHYMTFTTLKYLGSGQFEYAGAHLDILVFKEDTGECEEIQTTGTWLNILDDIENMTVNQKFKADKGDIIVLYTDGISEAFNRKKQMFGVERIKQVVRKNTNENVATILERVFDNVMKHSGSVVHDDMTLIVMKKI